MTSANARPSGRRGRRALTVAAVVALVLVVLLGLLWAMQRSVVYVPLGGEPPPAAEVIEGAEDVRLHTGDGLELGGWFVPARGADRETAVLVANGNAGNRESRAPLARALAAEGFSVLLFDYRGYGGNPGGPSEEGLAADVRAAASLLAERGFDAGDTIYFGESLGAAVVTELAVERPPAALFLRSPFSSLADMGARHYPFLPVRLLLWDRYPVTAQVAEVDSPTTVVVGAADRVVPPEQSRGVAAASANLFEEVVLPGAGHNDPETIHGPEVVRAFVRLADGAS
ncbi:pimeloyl-ACP methyl ester carboxylesterase [Nocardiopsis terrae]|uniref:Pimeloyl-ACP methyl ester carboxylesterase n=1 Tax=Nocardiopsis terrae TaxID=372655 RepID=A0ABR9HCC6_9ACTN|nr:alpha/beta hydrolase [Nocardiopsis terrae]MBE1456678.1 pimeloyl-ACP methyl ester carboxylesterase [Nocardiopsis terrae]